MAKSCMTGVNDLQRLRGCRCKGVACPRLHPVLGRLYVCVIFQGRSLESASASLGPPLQILEQGTVVIVVLLLSSERVHRNIAIGRRCSYRLAHRDSRRGASHVAGCCWCPALTLCRSGLLTEEEESGCIRRKLAVGGVVAVLINTVALVLGVIGRTKSRGKGRGARVLARQVLNGCWP